MKLSWKNIIKSILRSVTLVVTVVLWQVGCSSGDAAGIKASLGQEFVLPANQQAAIIDGGLTIKFESVITDSRCPKGVTCIWAGEAKCQMQITYNGSTSNIIYTVTGGTDGYSQSAFNNYLAYFKLEPYPEAGKQIGSQDYKLLLKIARSGAE